MTHQISYQISFLDPKDVETIKDLLDQSAITTLVRYGWPARKWMQFTVTSGSLLESQILELAAAKNLGIRQIQTHPLLEPRSGMAIVPVRNTQADQQQTPQPNNHEQLVSIALENHNVMMQTVIRTISLVNMQMELSHALINKQKEDLEEKQERRKSGDYESEKLKTRRPRKSSGLKRRRESRVVGEREEEKITLRRSARLKSSAR